MNAAAGAALGFLVLCLVGSAAAIAAILRRGRQRPRRAQMSPTGRKLRRRGLLMMIPGFVVIASAAVMSITGHPTVGAVILVGYAFLVATLTVITGVVAVRRSRPEAHRPFE